jgi:peptide/nickel transport system substrate-binding protein
MFTRRAFLHSTLAGAAGVLVPATASRAQTANPAAKRGGTLAAAIFADPLSFDPHITGNLQGRAACRAIHDTLLTVDANGLLAPGLVETWERPDDKTFVLKLRAGLKFHDGSALDAAAVKYNIDRIRNPSTNSIRGGEITALDTVTVVDARTVRLALKYPFAAFLYPFTDVSGCIGSPTAFEKWGKDYTLHPAGAGPFMLGEYQKDSRAVLERNPNYWATGKPYLDRVVLRPIPTDSTRLAELRSGGVQLAEALPLQDIARLRQGQELMVSEKVGFRWEYFGFNLRDQYPGKSKKFRQAFQYAIDREALHRAAYFGTGAVGYDGILPGSPFFDANYRPYKNDMDMAKKLIDEAGLGSSITLQAPLQPDPVKQRAGQIFQAVAGKLGVKVEITQVDSAGYRNSLQGGVMASDLQGWWGYRPDPDQYLAILLHSTGSYAKFHGYSNPAMDKLLDAQRAASNIEDRRKLFRQISELMNDDAVYVPWHYSSDFKGLDPKVKGFVHAQDGIVAFQDLYLS